MDPQRRSLILASSSVYRRKLLQQLGLEFSSISPDVDETAHANETADSLSRRLALAKAKAVLANNPNSIVIGSDQVADLSGRCLGKPDDANLAIAQLKASSGQTVRFFTALAVLSQQRQQVEVICTDVHFRNLSNAQIEAYIKKEEPLDCAGSFKCEGLGIALFESIQSDDPSALIGLPLISLVRMLHVEGLDV